MRSVTVAATQFACSWDLPANLDTAEALVRQAAGAGAQRDFGRGVEVGRAKVEARRVDRDILGLDLDALVEEVEGGDLDVRRAPAAVDRKPRQQVRAGQLERAVVDHELRPGDDQRGQPEAEEEAAEDGAPKDAAAAAWTGSRRGRWRRFGCRAQNCSPKLT